MSDPQDAGFSPPTFVDALKTFIDSVFGIVAPPLASPIDAATAVGGLGVVSKQNIVNGDAQNAGSSTGRFASAPTRYLSSNKIFNIPTIDIETPDTNYPAELGEAVGLYDFFKSSGNIKYQLPSVNDVSRYSSQNDSTND